MGKKEYGAKFYAFPAPKLDFCFSPPILGLNAELVLDVPSNQFFIL